MRLSKETLKVFRRAVGFRTSPDERWQREWIQICDVTRPPTDDWELWWRRIGELLELWAEEQE